MDIEGLNKTQFVFLVLLITFVVSIASSIMTVSLLQRAPDAVTQTINRIVERTVEKAVPGSTVTKEIKVVVKEEDLMVDAVSKNKARTVSIIKGQLEGTTTPKNILGYGFLAAKNGVVVFDAGSVEPGIEAGYSVVFGDGRVYPAVWKDTNDARVGTLYITPKDKKGFVVDPVLFADASKINPGQKVISLAQAGNIIRQGIVSSVKSIPGDTKESKPTMVVRTSLTAGDEDTGAPLVDLDGNVLGMMLSGRSNIVTSDDILSLIANNAPNASSATSTATGQVATPPLF